MKIPSLILLIVLSGTIGHVQTQNDFTVRGLYLDLRIQTMQLPALKALALQLHDQGINTLIMEWEASYPFQQDPQIANRYTYTRSQIKDFIDYCHQLNIDVIPLQQSFGHVEYILWNNKYAALREDEHDLSQVCPAQKDLNKVLFTRLFKDLAATHNSPYINTAGSVEDFHSYAAQIRTLMAKEPALDATFRRLNGTTLYPAAISEENAIRTYRTHRLYERLALSKF